MEREMDTVIQVRSRGTITLPAELREKYGIENGDLFRIVDIDGVFVLTPMVPMVPELAREIEQARLEMGLSIEELLQVLRDQRRRYYQENYGSGPDR
jgi:bifunctional DNA-binding transcriptional regulator/antitoxin component of YhaV-PrlF toxin-antitoxin module